jgi:hypothetical protein
VRARLPPPCGARTLSRAAPAPHPATSAPQAEAWSHSKAIGIFQKHPSATVVTSGELYPAGRSQAVTSNGQAVRGRARSAGGFVAANPVTLFGQTAIATTDLGARAFSGSNAVPMIERREGYRAVAASTNMRWEAVPARQGTGAGKERLTFTESSGSNDLAPLSSGISMNGGGPMAHAAAGQAVAMSFADTNDNERFGERR